MENSFTLKKFRIKELLLWDENARFPDKYFNKKENELVDFFVSKKDFKIKELGKSIIADIDLPQLEKLIVLNINDKNVVIEGNRRLTCYKLLSNPELTNSKNTSEFFHKIKSNQINSNFELECLVTNDIEQALRYVDRKHNNGNNEISWGQTERDNFKVRRGRASQKELFRIGISEIIKELDIPEEMKEQVLGKGFVTTLFRIIDSSPAYDLFGFNLKNGETLEYEDNDFPEKLKVIILNVLQKHTLDKSKKIDSRSLNKNADKEEYLKSIKTDDSKQVLNVIQGKTKNNLFGEQIANVSAKRKIKINPKSTSRNYLIPKSCRITINQNKINSIYRELRDDLILNDSKSSVPNAVGVLFRVFLEISLDEYAEKNMRIFKKDDTLKQKIPWVINSLQDKGYNPKVFNEIRKVGSAKNEKSFLSIDRFHEYVHSKTVQPSSRELKTKWDLLQPFFELLWEDLNDKN